MGGVSQSDGRGDAFKLILHDLTTVIVDHGLQLCTSQLDILIPILLSGTGACLSLSLSLVLLSQ